MGRPSLNVKRVSVNLPEDMPDRIDALVGPQRRSDFIREALEAALKVVETALNARQKDR